MSKNTSSLKEIRNYKFIIYPNKEQERKLTNWLETCRIIYNSAIADRRNYYDRNGKGLTRTQQQVTLKADKAKHPRVKGIHSQVAQEVLFRVLIVVHHKYGLHFFAPVSPVITSGQISALI